MMALLSAPFSHHLVPDSDEDDGKSGITIFFIVVALFLVATFKSCSEIRLSLVGKTASGEVENVLAEVDSKTREETGNYQVNFNFTAKTGDTEKVVRSDYVTTKKDAIMKSAGEKVDVLYLAGNPDISRVKGHREWFWVCIFVGMIVVIVLYIRHLLKSPVTLRGK